MDHFDDLYKERMAALLRAIYAAKYVKDDKIPAQIEEGLYLGSVGAANNKTLLKSLNITHILTVATSIPPAYPNDFTYKIVDVPDKVDVDIAQSFDECFCFINEAKRKGGILVHCFVGRSRSVTIVVAYLMKKHGMSLSGALNLVKSKRSVAAPNSGFMLQLQNYEKSLQGGLKENTQDSVSPLLTANYTARQQNHQRGTNRPQWTNTQTGGNRQNLNRNSTTYCQYCNILGHLTKECRKLSRFLRDNISIALTSAPDHVANVTTAGPTSMQPNWLFDTGASNHVTFDPSSLRNISEYGGPDEITLGNGSSHGGASNAVGVLIVKASEIKRAEVQIN